MKWIVLILGILPFSVLGQVKDGEAHCQKTKVEIPGANLVVLKPFHSQELSLPIDTAGPLHLNWEGYALGDGGTTGSSIIRVCRGPRMVIFIDGYRAGHSLTYENGLWYYNGLLLPLIHSAYKGQYITPSGIPAQYESGSELKDPI